MCRTKRNLGRDEAADWQQGPSNATERRTALFEGSDGAEAYAVSRVLADIGVDTMWCPGPDGGHGPRCPLVEEGHCDLMEKADFVINNLGSASSRSAAVAQATNSGVSGGKPVVVLTSHQNSETLRAQLARCRVVQGPLSTRIVREIAQTE